MWRSRVVVVGIVVVIVGDGDDGGIDDDDDGDGDGDGESGGGAVAVVSDVSVVSGGDDVLSFLLLLGFQGEAAGLPWLCQPALAFGFPGGL